VRKPINKEIEVPFSNKKKKYLIGGEMCQKWENRRYNASIVEEK
jgi:hypothetical protein